jgi:hypothetical protein
MFKAGIVLFFFVFLFSLFPKVILADTLGENAVSSSYTLAYPGILPDNPFYFLKAFRDKTIELFISHPLERAAYDLLQADKRVAASYLLLDRHTGKEVLAESTFSKGLNYFEDAITKASESKKQGMEVHDLAARLREANKKHLEVILNMEKMRRGDERFERLEKRVRSLGKRVGSLR